MTIKEAISAFPVINNLDGVLVNKTLVDRSVNGAAIYQGETKNFCLVIADLSKYAASLPDFSEGDLSLKFSRSQLLQQAAEYYERGGEPKYNVSNGTDQW